MASHRDDAVLPGEEDLDSSSQDEDEDDVDEDDDEDEENDDVSPSTSSAGDDAVPVAVASVAEATAVTIALPAVPNGEPAAAPILAATAVISADPLVSDRHRLIDLRNDAALVAQPEEKKPAAAPMDDSRKLFQRLWTDEDEIELLQGFLDYSAQRGNRTTHHGQNDTALFYDQIKSKLQLEFNKNQLVEKLRRLKKKYRNVLNKISSGKEFTFKSSHDQATFEISRKIWTNIGGVDTAMDDDDPSPSAPQSNFIIEVKGEDAGGFAFERRTSTAATMATPTPRSRKRSRPKSDPRTEERRCLHENSAPIKENYSNQGGINHNSNTNGNVQGLIEETVRSCLSPVFKELLSSSMGGGGGGGGGGGPCAVARGFGGLAMNPALFSLGSIGMPPMNLGMIGELAAASISAAAATDERWRRQQILELEVYSKRLELVQDQIKAALEDLRSRRGSS